MNNLMSERIQEGIPMLVKWKILIAKVLVWMTLELILNLLGLDQMADYGEFLFHPRPISLMSLKAY